MHVQTPEFNSYNKSSQMQLRYDVVYTNAGNNYGFKKESHV